MPAPDPGLRRRYFLAEISEQIGQEGEVNTETKLPDSFYLGSVETSIYL